MTKKHLISSSEESIENLIYFKDCQHKAKEEETQPQPLLARDFEPAHREPECRFPRMCCALTCDNECNNQQNFASRQAKIEQQPIRNPHLPHPQQPPVQPQIQKERKKKPKSQPKSQSMIQPPIGGRRDFGFTKEKIKSLISNDEDIRKILKDLVRVTMQKVDLQDMLTAKNYGNMKSEIPDDNDADELE